MERVRSIASSIDVGCRSMISFFISLPNCTQSDFVFFFFGILNLIYIGTSEKVVYLSLNFCLVIKAYVFLNE